jgi:hypothetical protein
MPDVPLPTLFLGLFIGALAVLIPLFAVAYGFFQKFATKAELNAHREEIERIKKQFTDELKATESRLTITLTDNRQIHEQHYATQETKLDGLIQTMQLFTNEMSRVVGSLEGRAAVTEKVIDTIQHHAAPH